MVHFMAADAAEPLSSASSGQLALAALAGIAVVVLGITAAKLHPFLALILGSAALALVAWVPGEAAVKSFTTGFGTTVGSVGLLVALGAMVGQLLADSGGGNAIVDKLVFGVKAAALPWMMALVAAIIGLPMFFEIGVVLLIPVVLSVARRAKQPVLLVGIPALAGLSVLHALVPPHPGPVAAIEAVKADTGRTLMFGVLLAIPTLIIAGPLLARLIARLVPVDAPAELAADAGSPGAAVGDSDLAEESADGKAASPATKRPSFGAAIGCILLPVVLMLLASITEIFLPDSGTFLTVVKFFGTPSVALMLAVLVALFALGKGSGMSLATANGVMSNGLPAVAGIILIVAAGGGFKTLLVDAGVGNVIKEWAEGKNLSPLLMAWLVAVGIRLATGSATVATITAAGIVAPMLTGLDANQLALVVLAIGCGSVFFSHVNDAGFWLVKEYFGLTVVQTLKSWSLMETVISVAGFAFCAMAWMLV
ncbi:gluconate transporter [Dermacoccus sp. 147Ba]|uniref:GntT/GntP/DsdX family permease n=1 Tax=Dermacoccus sp. 147Ba TaxID=2510111 RepID=UPI00101DEB36|nr:gluconate:H+ symporter [Dermacoccus sp. 147Ba]RYI22371.1 gluconate transporter [Dermacoccus sp. 147Ba]